MDVTEKLYATEEIKQLKARYFRGVDLKDAALLESVFTHDAVADYRGAATDPVNGLNAAPESSTEVLHGANAITAAVMTSVKSLVSVHHGSIPEIDFIDDVTATAVWPMVDRLWMNPGEQTKSLVGYGHYYETYRKIDGEWKMSHLRLERLRVEVESQ